MPPLVGYDHLIGYLYACGPVVHSMAGPVGLPWSEVKAWSEKVVPFIDTWEFEAIYRLSAVYAAEQSKAGDPMRFSPYQPDVVDTDQAHRDRIDDKLRDAFASMAADPKNPGRPRRSKKPKTQP